jgi:hypothetical protein
MSTLRDIKAGVPQVSVLSSSLYNLYISYIPETARVNLALFGDDNCMYATGHKEGYVLRKIQRGLKSMTAWCKQWTVNSLRERLKKSTSFIELNHLIISSHIERTRYSVRK